MDTYKTIDHPEIRYRITYVENLTFKDLEDLINLIRVSNNNAFQQLGVPRAKGNELQRIEKVEHGSIEIVLESIKEILDAIKVAKPLITAINFVHISVEHIVNKIKLRRERQNRSAKEEKKVYEKNEVTVEVVQCSDSAVYVIHINVCKQNCEDVCCTSRQKQ